MEKNTRSIDIWIAMNISEKKAAAHTHTHKEWERKKKRKTRAWKKRCASGTREHFFSYGRGHTECRLK